MLRQYKYGLCSLDSKFFHTNYLLQEICPTEKLMLLQQNLKQTGIIYLNKIKLK